MKDPEKNIWRGRIIRYAPVFLWIGVIFFLSSDSGSMSETSRFVGPILKFFFPNAPEATIQQIHGYVRKTAHFTEYAILALFALRAFGTSSVDLLRRNRYLLPIILVAVVAATDELNQSFEASRTASVWDSLLDISGGAAMMLFLWILKWPRSMPRTDA